MFHKACRYFVGTQNGSEPNNAWNMWTTRPHNFMLSLTFCNDLRRQCAEAGGVLLEELQRARQIQTGFSLPAFGDPCTGARARHRQRTVTPRIYILLYMHTLYICGVSIEIRLDGDSEKSVILAIYESRYFNVTIQELQSETARLHWQILS